MTYKVMTFIALSNLDPIMLMLSLGSAEFSTN